MANVLLLSQLKHKHFVIEYRNSFLRQFGLKICSPEYWCRTWRPWDEWPTQEEREDISWKSEVTLCEMCKLACGGCSWADEFKPVDGWKATPTLIHVTSGNVIPSFQVDECPKFSPGRGRPRMPEALDTLGCGRLFEAMMRVARADYVLGNAGDRAHIESWIRDIQELVDPENVISELRDQARICDLHPEKRKKYLRGEELF